MPRTRVIPVLLLRRRGLVKTVRFRSPTYVGDPINVVRIFNEKEVDELVLTEITATRAGAAPDYELLEQIASEAFMPICYGGGITTPDQVRRQIDFRVAVGAITSVPPPTLAGRTRPSPRPRPSRSRRGRRDPG